MGRLAVFKLMYFVSILMTLIIVGITIMGAFTSYANPSQYPFMAFLGLALPTLLIINILLFIYWIIRRRFWIWFPLIAIVANVQFLGAMFQFPKNKSVSNVDNLKIATYNVHSFNNEITGYTAKEIADYMDNQHVDVICFQELSTNMDFNLDSLRQAYKQYPYIAIPDNNLRVTVFSKYPIENYKLISFSESSNCGMWADIQVKGETIRVFNVHLQTTSLNSAEAEIAKKKLRGDTEGEKMAFLQFIEQTKKNFDMRAEQAHLIQSYIKVSNYPVILCGDFNDIPSSYTYREMKSTLEDGFKTCGSGYGYTYRGLYGLLRIDYIFYNPQFKGIRYYSPSLDWSDHNPVICEMEMQ